MKRLTNRSKCATLLKYVGTYVRTYVTLVTTYVLRLTLGLFAMLVLVCMALSYVMYVVGRLIFRMLASGTRNIRRQLSR